jgi:hypothetical protein
MWDGREALPETCGDDGDGHCGVWRRRRGRAVHRSIFSTYALSLLLSLIATDCIPPFSRSV